ncbi:hypothetical protein JVU11DRAFT_9534 [Chiua virens]|nr:hypothetical protein JVU11DRAFT_9534 [Chiua virens]
MATTSIPLKKSSFSFDISGVSGFFGGDEAISAMATVHVYSGRRFLGWYNTPGSYEIAKCYGRIPKSAFFRGLFPGIRTEPAELFEFDGQKGQGFRGVKSGTECASINGKPISGRPATKIEVTIAKLNTIPESAVYPKRILDYFTILAIFPILSSLATCIVCGVYEDWFSFSLILLGILSNGISCFVIGSGQLCFTHPTPAAGSPPGDGILGSGAEFVVLQGEEGAVNSITRGKFSIKFSNENYEQWIGCCSILLTIQLVAQLFLVPQGTLFGQLMFISSLGVSWFYNMLLSISDREQIQRRILVQEILGKPPLTKYTLTTYTAAVIFMLLILRHKDPRKMLDVFIPNETKVWNRWKDTVSERLLQGEALHFVESDWELNEYTADEQKLLGKLYGDARAAYDGSRAPLSQDDMLENRSNIMITRAITSY